MLTLFSRADQEDFTQKLVDYGQGVLDVTGYNRALLTSVSPAALDLPEDVRTQAARYYNDAVHNANDWIQKIARDCTVIPECVVGYDYLFRMNAGLLKSGLEALRTDPDNGDIKSSLSGTLAGMGDDFAGFISDTEAHIKRINDYYAQAKKDKEHFTQLLKDVAAAISLDEKLRDEIKEKIRSAYEALNKAELRLKKDDILLNSKAFIIVAVLTLGIALLVTCADRAAAEKEIKNQKRLIDEYTGQLQDKLAAITALTLAQTSYQKLCEGIEALMTSSGAVVDVWRDMKNRFQVFADKIAAVGRGTDVRELDAAIAAVSEMSASWDGLYALSDALSKIEYETVTVSESAA